MKIIKMKYLFYLSCFIFGVVLGVVTDFGIFDWQYWLITFSWLLTMIASNYD